MKIFNSITRFLYKHDELFILFLSIIIGVLAGYGNLVFRFLISFFQRSIFGNSDEAMLYILENQPFYKILLAPAIGGLIIGLLSLLFKSAKGHGVPDVIKAVILGKKIPPFVAIIKTISSSITIGSGGSAGREGPIIQIGAALGSGVARMLKFSGNRLRTLLACGASGGLAATFNAPMGGAMFASEIIVGDFSIKTFSPIIVSSVVATVVSRHYLGNNITFSAPPYEFKDPIELIFYALLGVFCSIIGVLFIKVFYKTEEYFDSLSIHSFLKPALGGFILGLIALFSRRIMGVGYATIMDILNGNLMIYSLLVLIFLKIIATSLTLSSGGAGGLFVPSLFIGAATGGFFGTIIHTLYPISTASSGAYALVAMSAMLASTMRAPITAILIIFEITQSYDIILPLMICTIISNVMSNFLINYSIFTYPLTKEGIRIKTTTEESILNNIKVKDVMIKDDIITFKKSTPLYEIINGIQKASHLNFPVADDNNNLIGMLSLDDIKSVMFDESVKPLLVADDICRKKDITYIYPDETLADAMSKMGLRDLGAIPVVEKTSNNKLKLLGLLRRSDIIIAYNKAFMAELK
jgi:CIC family chloride channel protein